MRPVETRSFALVGIALAGLALAACGGQGEPGDEPARTVAGLRVVVESQADFTRAADFDDRLLTTLEASLAYWGGTWADVEQRTVRLVDTAYVTCGGRESLGCFDGGEVRLTTRDPSIGPFACIEQTVLVHEIGHVVLGDRNHTDPRWMEMDPLAAELSGRQGYADGGTLPCETYLSVWRHPLGSP